MCTSWWAPALIKQDPVEAKSNVETRLNLIKGELSRLEGQAKSIEEKRAQKQQQVGNTAHSGSRHSGSACVAMVDLQILRV